MNSKTKLIAAGLAMFVAIPVFIWLWVNISHLGTTPVEISVIPGDALVKINDENFSNKKTAHLKPGSYSIVISKEGFETDKQNLVIKEGDSKASIISMPTPTSSEALLWAEGNTDKYLALEGKVGKASTQQGQDFIKKHPIIEALPIQKAIFSIGYKSIDTRGDDIIITINAYEGFREAALEEIRDQGYDPSDYKIEFTDYRSPFDE